MPISCSCEQASLVRLSHCGTLFAFNLLFSSCIQLWVCVCQCHHPLAQGLGLVVACVHFIEVGGLAALLMAYIVWQ